jgi:prophage regulatory protein
MTVNMNYRRARQILRRKQVEEITGLSRSTIYQWMKNGSFPAPITLGSRSVGWDMAEIQDWIEQCRIQSTNTTTNLLRSAHDAHTNSHHRSGNQVLNQKAMGGRI